MACEGIRGMHGDAAKGGSKASRQPRLPARPTSSAAGRLLCNAAQYTQAGAWVGPYSRRGAPDSSAPNLSAHCALARPTCCAPLCAPPAAWLLCCRKVANPRVLLMDCPLEYKKLENQANVELMKEEDWWAGWGLRVAGRRAGSCRGLLGGWGLPSGLLGLVVREGAAACLLLSCRSTRLNALSFSPHPPATLFDSTEQHRAAQSAHPATPPRRATLLKMEEEWIERTCSQIAAFKPDLVITEKVGAGAARCAAGVGALCAPQKVGVRAAAVGCTPPMA